MNIKDVTPLFSKIIVQKEGTDVTSSGIIIPESARKGTMDSHEGTVVAVGGDVSAVEVGESVLFGQYSGTKFKLGKPKPNDPKYLIMNEEDVLCKIKEK